MAALLHLAARRCALIVSDDDDNTVKRIPTSHNEGYSVNVSKK